MQFDDVLLEPPQIETLTMVVEAARATPREQRQEFWFHHTLGHIQAHLSHPGLHDAFAHQSDLEVLAREGLISIRYERGPSRGGHFDITPLGHRFYEYLVATRGQPVEHVEQQIESYVNGDRFRLAHPRAYDKWHAAVQAHAAPEARVQPSTIGHLCREAMQEFADTMIITTGEQDDYPDKAKTVSRIQRVLRLIDSDTERAFMKAIITYWGTVADLVQKQEHDAQREGTALTWEDGRRIIFHTAVVMYEISRVVDRAANSAVQPTRSVPPAS